MKKQLLVLLSVLSIAGISSAQMDSAYYHHSAFSSQYGAGGAYPSFDYYRYVTRFTPPYYPAQLVGVKEWFRNAGNPSSFKTVVYKDPSAGKNGPTSSTPDYISPAPMTNPAQGGVADSAYGYFDNLASQNIIVTAGDVYAGATQYLQQNGFLGIAIDTSNALGTQDRPWVYIGSWTKMINWAFMNGEWGITAYFIPAPATSTEELMNNISSVAVFPQPASDEAYIAYELKNNSNVSIGIYNQVGEKVTENILNQENQSAGNYSVSIPVNNLSNGIYFVRLVLMDSFGESNEGQVVKKLTVIK